MCISICVRYVYLCNYLFMCIYVFILIDVIYYLYLGRYYYADVLHALYFDEMIRAYFQRIVMTGSDTCMLFEIVNKIVIVAKQRV